MFDSGRIVADITHSSSPLFYPSISSIIHVSVSWLKAMSSVWIAVLYVRLRKPLWCGNDEHERCITWRGYPTGDADCLLCIACGLLRPVSWLGNYTMCVIGAMSGVFIHSSIFILPDTYSQIIKKRESDNRILFGEPSASEELKNDKD
ncbi:hypothetical protein Tco_1575093 [Tanacetum coccineum]